MGLYSVNLFSSQCNLISATRGLCQAWKLDSVLSAWKLFAAPSSMFANLNAAAAAVVELLRRPRKMFPHFSTPPQKRKRGLPPLPLLLSFSPHQGRLWEAAELQSLRNGILG